MQYGLFLKGIGVTLPDSLRFWRSEFTKIMEPEKVAEWLERLFHGFEFLCCFFSLTSSMPTVFDIIMVRKEKERIMRPTAAIRFVRLIDPGLKTATVQ